MDRYAQETAASATSPPSEIDLFVQAILGRPAPQVAPRDAEATAERRQLEWLAQISDRHAEELRTLQAAEAEARRKREILEWSAQISTRAEVELRSIQQTEQRQQQSRQVAQRFIETESLTEWNETDHPRAPRGTSTGGQFVSKGGRNPSDSGIDRRLSTLDRIIRRNLQTARISGVDTPAMRASTRLAGELQTWLSLPGELKAARDKGLLIGGKALANGSATAVKNVVTLGLSPGQLELIGVTKEDREHGYDTAVAISTASGELLIAVGTGGLATALSKGGTVLRVASGALVAFDTAGNAVGVVAGVHDAASNGITIGSGAQVAGSLLGLTANAKTGRDLARIADARRLAKIDEYVATLPKTPTRQSRPEDLYERRHTGPYNYEISGGGKTFQIDGYRGSTILEAKHVEKPKASPYVPGSTCDERIRELILSDARKRLGKVETIIKSGSTPFTAIEVITNTPGSKLLFEGMLKELGLPGTVRLAK